MSGSQLLLLGGVPAAAIPVDPYFYSVTSLLHGDGTNGGQNNTFLDSSSNNFTITRNGNTTQGSFSPFSQTGWSNYFDGSGDYLSISSAVSTFQGIGANNFSYECFVYPLRQTNTYAQGLITYGLAGNLGSSTCDLVINASGYFQLAYATGSAATLLSPSLAAINQWSHIAVCRSGSTLSMFVNGIRVATASTSATVGSSGDVVYIGNQWYAVEATRQLQGYISNARVLIGSSAYDATSTTITVPSTPLTAITNTSLLTCQANRFLDASSNNFTITRGGDTSVQPFSPFNPTTAYSTSAVGGSGYFDGSGDYLTAPNNAALDLGAGDFTLEIIWYPTAIPGSYYLLDKSSTNGWNLGGNASSFSFWANGANRLIFSRNPIIGQWNHIVVERVGSTIYGWINGVSAGTTTYSAAISESTIFSLSANSLSINGYATCTRLVKGSAVYSGTAPSFPTIPLTAVTNTQLLLNFTNGAIFDNAAVADYETVGNAQISTSVKKYGTGSMSFDGTGDWLITDAPSTQLQAFGTGDFTIEMWVYVNSVAPTFQHIYDGRPATTDGAYPCIRLSSATLQYIVSGSVQITGPSLSVNTWYHLAVSRVASQTKMFVNGTQVGSTYADTNSYLNPASRPVIGGWGYNLSGGYEFNGYIDDLRISKGVGRYPYNFTPPTAEFPNIGGTVTLTADPYYEYTTLLLPGNGTNGAQNNTFLDSSTNAFTITRNGNTTQGTFSPFSQTGWSNNFDGSGDYLTFTGSSALTATGDFTFECWIYVRSIALSGASNPRILTSPNGLTLVLVASTNNLRVDNDGTGTSPISTANNSIIFNQWMHVAVVRSGSTLTAYLNGTAAGSATHTSTFTGTGSIGIGYTSAGPGGYFDGYISNMRMVVGTAVYTANFTPPTAALTAITNTQLLTCQSNRFIDNSSNAFAITRNGDVSVQAFSPFNPTAAWSAATYGGSGYFDGSGDYLAPADSNTAYDIGQSSTPFTVECWAYATQDLSGATAYNIFQRGGGTDGWSTSSGIQFALFAYSSQIYWSWNNAGSPLELVSTAGISQGRWFHVAASYNGTTTALFLNGVRQATSTTGYTLPTTRNIVRIGTKTAATTPAWAGYVSDLRVVKGTAIYDPTQTSVTIPTAPLTAVTNTQFLMSATNAGIYDATSKNDLETVGNAQISTTQSKFGGSSIYVDGNGDYGKAPYNALYDFGSGDLTIECWVYPTANAPANDAEVVSFGQTTTLNGWHFGLTGTGTVNRVFFGLNYSGYLLTSSGTVSLNTWTHIAVTKYGSSWKLFINGINDGTATSSSTATVNTSCLLYVGSASYDPGSTTRSLTGYINDLRITKGIARYTSNFTPPTTAFLTL